MFTDYIGIDTLNQYYHQEFWFLFPILNLLIILSMSCFEIIIFCIRIISL